LPFSRVKRLSKQRVLQLMLERYQKLVAWHLPYLGK
jgi:hypothetical protein